MTEKIVRGIWYHEKQQFILPPLSVEFVALTDEHSRPIVELLETYGVTHAHAPGIVVRHATAPEDQATSIFEIHYWQAFKSYAYVLGVDL